MISKTQSTKKYLYYESTRKHPERNKERLPSQGDRFVQKPPFKLESKRARFNIKCSNKNCQKERIVFAETKPTQAKIKQMKKKVEDSTYVCGDTIDDLKIFVCKET